MSVGQTLLSGGPDRSVWPTMNGLLGGWQYCFFPSNQCQIGSQVACGFPWANCAFDLPHPPR
jgi:hypothetical protein